MKVQARYWVNIKAKRKRISLLIRTGIALISFSMLASSFLGENIDPMLIAFVFSMWGISMMFLFLGDV